MNKFMLMPNLLEYMVNTKFTKWPRKVDIELMPMHNPTPNLPKFALPKSSMPKYAKLQNMYIVRCTQRKQSNWNQGVCAQCTYSCIFKENKVIKIEVHYVYIIHSKKVVSMHVTSMLNSCATHKNNVKFSNNFFC